MDTPTASTPVVIVALLAFLWVLRIVAQPRPDVGLAQPDRSFAARLVRVGSPQDEDMGGGPAVGDGWDPPAGAVGVFEASHAGQCAHGIERHVGRALGVAGGGSHGPSIEHAFGRRLAGPHCQVVLLQGGAAGGRRYCWVFFPFLAFDSEPRPPPVKSGAARRRSCARFCAALLRRLFRPRFFLVPPVPRLDLWRPIAAPIDLLPGRARKTFRERSG